MQSKERYYKNKYIIAFYDAADEWLVVTFDNIPQICEYKRKELTPNNLNLISVEVSRAKSRLNGTTRMLTGELMHIHLINAYDDDEEE